MRHILGWLLLWTASGAYANTAPQTDTAEAAQSPHIELPQIEVTHQPNRLDRSRDWLGNYLNNTSQSLDLFFTERFFGDQVLTGTLPADTKAKLFFEAGYVNSSEGFVGDVGIDLKLALPHTQEKLRFVLTSNEENENRVNDQTIRQRVDDESDDFFTGLEFIISEVENWNPSFEIGARWSSSPELFVDFRIRRDIGDEDHRLSLFQSAAFFSERQFISTTRVNYSKLLNETFGFRVFNQIRYFDREEFVSYSHVPSLIHKLSDRNALIYQVAIAGSDEEGPSIDSYTSSIIFRRRIYNTWLFLEIEPQYTKSVSSEIESAAGLFVRLEMLINQ